MAERSVRMRRVDEAVKEVLGVAISGGLKDPRIGFVTITGVRTTSDLRGARVYVSVYGTEREKNESLSALRSAEGVLQAKINEELRLKRTPTLEFIYDESVDEGMKIDAILKSEKKELEPGWDEETEGEAQNE